MTASDSMTSQILLKNAVKRLQSATPTPQLDAELLLAEALSTSRAHLYTHPETITTEPQVTRLEELITRRLSGEPIATILGHQGFWTLDLIVTKDTLIPRPETERIIELTLEKLTTEPPCKICDLGTGCGAIALAIASERPHWTVHATDQSEAALNVARQNAERLALRNVSFYKGEWCNALPDIDYDAILSNPPYIARNDTHLDQGDIRFEPQSALVSGQDGLDAIRTIVAQSKSYLKRGGWLIMEHGYDQGPAVIQLLEAAHYKETSDHRDLQGHKRVATCTR